jgi:F0F1-type ATP synthase epsilon subunit
MLIDVEDQKDIDKNAVELAKNDALALMEKYKQGKDRVDMEKFIEAEDNLMKSIAQLKLYETRK